MIIIGKGQVFPSEITTYYDRISGAKVTKLTSYLAHEYHLYFTNLGWYEDNQKLLICSDRANCSNLYSVDLKSGKQTQLTDYSSAERPNIHGTYINPHKKEAYFTFENQIIALDLESYAERSIFNLQAGYNFSSLSCTADGKYLCFGASQDLSDQIEINLGSGYVGFEEIEAARPNSKIYELNLETKEATVIHEENRWIGHVNTSPTQSHLLTFCHEGPWDVVDHRLWVLDRTTRKAWRIRDNVPNQFAGHEYWHMDGVTVGYHGFTDAIEHADGKFLGHVRYDGTEQHDYEFPYPNMHVHSNKEELIVGDGSQPAPHHGQTYQDCIFLWKKVDGDLKGPRILCRHRCSSHSQKVHVHPRISPDGKQILFTSDMDGYGNVYLVDLLPYEDLPYVEDGKLIK